MILDDMTVYEEWQMRGVAITMFVAGFLFGLFTWWFWARGFRRIRDQHDAAVQTKPEDLKDADFKYQAACSGLWYRSPGACGEVSAIRHAGRTYQPISQFPLPKEE